jgi:glycosyltransferase involved in cell wall biosynthesis
VELVYVSHGNIPSRWAHTVQVMKSSEALARLVPRFELVTASGITRRQPVDADLWERYGVTDPFAIRRLPLWWRPRDPSSASVRSRRFDLAAVLYVRMRRPRLAVTRARRIALGCARFGVPTLLELHGEPTPEKRPVLRALIGHPALRGIVVVSRPLAEFCLNLGAREDRVAIHPNGIDLTRFDRDPGREKARRDLGLPEDSAIAVYLGHLYDYKGIPTVVAAARRLPAVHFLLIGGWPEDVRRWLEATGDLPNVRFTGFVPNRAIPQYLACADLCLLPHSAASAEARWTCPLKLLEYMAARRPVVASDIPALRALLRDGHNALLVRPDGPEELAAAVRCLLEKRELADRLAAQARREVEEMTWDQRSRAILERFAPELLTDRG